MSIENLPKREYIFSPKFFPEIDEVLMSSLPKNPNGSPYLFLAPMEGLGDRPFRKAMARVGGFNEACSEFLRVPANAHVESLAKRYHPGDTHPIPQAVQLMGSDAHLMSLMAQAVEKRGAPRIDLNCGCPSNTVTGRGAGSSLLKNPEHLYRVAKAMVEAVSVPVTAKLRSGFDDTSLFKENLQAAQASGIAFLTLHPRTKAEGYGPPANWDLIAEAKELLEIPVVGNGDILTVQDACRMLQETRCDALMIGRGAAINPFIFQEIQARFSGKTFHPEDKNIEGFLHTFLEELPQELTRRGKLNKIKQLFSCLFKQNASLLEKRALLLSAPFDDADTFLPFALELYRNGSR